MPNLFLKKPECFLTFFALLFLSACDQSDGNDRTPVDYRILSGANQVKSISFTGANGQPANVGASDLSDTWSQRIWVVKPFNASATVSLHNPTDGDAAFVLQISSRDEQLATITDTLRTASDSTFTISASVAN